MIALRTIHFDTPCTVDLEHTDDYLGAHVELAGGVAIGPGDRVLVHGAPIRLDFGERRIVQRIATVQRASTMARLWTKFSGHFQMTELYELSFSDRILP